jgi:hypothetical protein
LLREAQLANIACQAKEVLGVDELEAVADRGYYSGEEILACHEAGITVTLPKPVTSGIEARGRFGKQDFVYLGDEDMYRCPAGEKLKHHCTNEENGQKLRRYWTNACRDCGLKRRCTAGVQRRIARWEHEHVPEAVQKRLDKNPQAMRQRRETAEHPFGTLKMRMGATHFLLAYNLTRVINIMGSQPLMAAFGLSQVQDGVSQSGKFPILPLSQSVLTRPRPSRDIQACPGCRWLWWLCSGCNN